MLQLELCALHPERRWCLSAASSHHWTLQRRSHPARERERYFIDILSTSCKITFQVSQLCCYNTIHTMSFLLWKTHVKNVKSLGNPSTKYLQLSCLGFMSDFHWNSIFQRCVFEKSKPRFNLSSFLWLHHWAHQAIGTTSLHNRIYFLIVTKNQAVENYIGGGALNWATFDPLCHPYWFDSF